MTESEGISFRRVEKKKNLWSFRYERCTCPFILCLVPVCLCFFLNSMFLRWTRDRRAMRVMSIERKKWMNIRPLPTKKQMPLQFDVHT